MKLTIKEPSSFAVVGMVILWLGFWGAVIAVAWHFIAKWW